MLKLKKAKCKRQTQKGKTQRQKATGKNKKRQNAKGNMQITPSGEPQKDVFFKSLRLNANFQFKTKQLKMKCFFVEETTCFFVHYEQKIKHELIKNINI